MKIKRRNDAPAVEVPGYAGVTKQVVLGPGDGSGEIVMRHFSVAEGGTTPRHSHEFPHLVKVEAGRGAAVDAAGDEREIAPGDYVYVAPNEIHNFSNVGEEPFEFMCIVPVRGEPAGT